MKKILKDIQEYGEAISLYRRKGKGNRRPILLVHSWRSYFIFSA